MPRKGPAKRVVAVRLSDPGIDWLDTEARRRGILRENGLPSRSAMMRLCFQYAAKHMPKGWKP